MHNTCVPYTYIPASQCHHKVTHNHRHATPFQECEQPVGAYSTELTLAKYLVHEQATRRAPSLKETDIVEICWGR